MKSFKRLDASEEMSWIVVAVFYLVVTYVGIIVIIIVTRNMASRCIYRRERNFKQPF